MLYKRLLPILAFALIALPGVQAQSLPALTPPGAAGGLYTRNLGIKKPFFIDFLTEWNRLGFADAFKDPLKKDAALDEEELEAGLEIFSLDMYGREGLLVFYPSGEFFLLAHPSASRVDQIVAAIDKAMKNPQTRQGWKLERSDLGGTRILAGHNGELVLVGTENVVERFLAGDRGLKLPIAGDLAFWIDAKPLWPLLEDPNLGLPPDVVRSIRTLGGLYWALDIQEGGVFTRSRFPVFPDQDAELARLLLPDGQAWALDDLPQGMSASSFVLDLAALGDYLTNYAQTFGMQDFQIDLSAFGSRLALVDAGTDDPREALQNPLGNMLLVMETRDTLTAEVTLLTWIQSLAGFSTPEGSGGFSVEALEIDGKPAKKLSVGMLGNLYLVTGEDRLYLATSERAVQLLQGDTRFADDANYRRLAGAYLPDTFVSASFTNNRQSLEQLAQLLPLMMVQSIEDPEVQATTLELVDKYAQFLKFVAERMGSGISYSQVQGSELIGSGFTEVAW